MCPVSLQIYIFSQVTLPLCNRFEIYEIFRKILTKAFYSIHDYIRTIFLGKIEKSLEKETQVRAKKQEIVIQFKDAQGGYKRGSRKTIQINRFRDSAIKRLKKAYGSTQKSSACRLKKTFKLLAVGKVEIGSAVCRPK